MDSLIAPLSTTVHMKVKPSAVKQEFEKQDELKRSALRAVAALITIPDSGEESVRMLYWRDTSLNALDCCIGGMHLSIH